MPNDDGTPTPEETAAAEAAEAAAAATEAAAADSASLATATAALTATTDAFRNAVREANPDLPDSAFTGANVADIQTGIDGARGILYHAAQFNKDHPGDEKPAPPATPKGAGAQRAPDSIPDNVHGVNLIKLGLDRQDAAAGS